MMRKVHLVSVTEPLIFDMAIAIHQKGYEVSTSGDGLSVEQIARLQEAGCSCYGNGWFPEKLKKDIQIVVLGATVKNDNPELIRAKELGLLIQSVPEFIFERTKSKTRVVVAGSFGKRSILTLIAYALQKQKLSFDYIFSTQIDPLPTRMRLGYESRIALIEGDEHITSALEKRFQLEFYRPHIAVLTSLCWSEEKDHKCPEEYIQTYKDFTASIEREGKLIYFEGDETVKELALAVREDITSIPYDGQAVIEKDGQIMIHTRYGDYPIRIPDEYFLLNMTAARLVCRQLGVKDADFYKAISELTMNS